MLTVYSQHIHHMFTKFSQYYSPNFTCNHVYHMITTCLPHVHPIFTTCSTCSRQITIYAPMDDDRPCFVTELWFIQTFPTIREGIREAFNFQINYISVWGDGGETSYTTIIFYSKVATMNYPKKTRLQYVPIAALCLYNIQRENIVF